MRIFRIFLLVVGCLFMPFFWAGFLVSGLHSPISELYKSFFEHYKSGQSFGIYD